MQRAGNDGAIRVIVADTGVGMDVSAVFGIGLANLESRLRGFFGRSVRLELHEAEPHGLSAEIVFDPNEGAGAAAIAATR